jgi:hypothetical protein
MDVITADQAVKTSRVNRVFQTTQALNILEAFERFGKGVTVSTPELGTDLPAATDRLFVKMTGPRVLMDMAACSLLQTLPKAGVLLHLPKIDPDNASVTLRVPLESGSVVMDINDTRQLAGRAMALRERPPQFIPARTLPREHPPQIIEAQIAKIA